MNHSLMMLSMPGWPELAVVGFIVLLIFGNRLPQVARSIGHALTEFKAGLRENSSDDQRRQ